MMTLRLLLFAPCFLDFFLQITALKYSCEDFQEYGYYAEYGGKCFIHELQRFSWYEAKRNCEALGGQLPRLEQSDQYDFVMNHNNYYRSGEKFKQEYTSVFGWIDGQKIDGKLYWTNGQLMTLSKRFVWSPAKHETGTFCIVGSRDVFQLKECNEESFFFCQLDKQSLPLKAELSPTTSVMVRFTTELTTSTMILMTTTEDMTSHPESKTTYTDSPLRATIHSQDQMTVKTWNEMNFRNVRHTNGVLNPKLKLNPDRITNDQTLIQCAVECLSQGVCELFNFEGQTGQCHLYHDIDMALKEGAESIPGWRLYKHGSLIID